MPTVAIIGASADRSKFGNKSVRAHAQAGYQVYPVNPRETEIEGWPVFRSILDVPESVLDRVSMYLPESLALSVLPDIATKQVDEVWFNPGADGAAVLKRARELGLNVVAGCSIVDLGIYPEELAD
jgi:predicted CoA-binding protein